MPQVKHYSDNRETDVMDRGVNNTSHHEINAGKVVSASLAGLAGGAVIATAIIGSAGLAVAIAGSLVGAAITGTSEYLREKR